MMIPEALQDLKEKITRRQELATAYLSYKERIINGLDFFMQQINNPSATKLKDGAKTFKDIMVEMNDISSEIFELDAVIVSRLEAEFLDSIVKIRTNQSQNEAGDIIHPGLFYFIPECYTKENMTFIDENDLWFLKIIKAAFSVQNIEIEEKRKEKQDD